MIKDLVIIYTQLFIISYHFIKVSEIVIDYIYVHLKKTIINVGKLNLFIVILPSDVIFIININ